MVHVGHVNGGEWRLGGKGEKPKGDILGLRPGGKLSCLSSGKLLEHQAEVALCLEPRLQHGGLRRGGCCPSKNAAEPGFLPSDLRLSEQHFPGRVPRITCIRDTWGACSTPRSQYPLDHPNTGYMRAGSIDVHPGDFGPNFVI